jgi:DEAD/DEAH box helicase domain-containing protein
VYTSDVQKAEEKRITEGSLAGNGVVNVRRSVHGYKKLSAITRVELSRTELSLPAMEFDTFAFWLDTEASALRCIVKEYDEGVHALSHAILSAAPLFVPCGDSDLNCDHTVYDCTRIVIFDMRAGGSGNCAQLFKHIFVPGGLLHTAVELMENCGHCQEDPDRGYQGGCPACVHFGQCLKFNQHLNRIAAVHIGKRLLKRVEQTTLFKENAARFISEGRRDGAIERTPLSPESSGQKLQTPRRKARERALREAKQIKPTKERGVVLGRPSWPTDEDGPGGRQVQADL